MSKVITKWVDLDDPEFKTVEYYTYIRKVVLAGLEYKIITPDKMGNLYMDDGATPISAELNGETVGVRYSMKALN